MAIIFSASTDSMSSQRTSRFIGPFLRWLIPEISAETISRVQFTVRKIAHMVEYGILAGLLWFGCRQTSRQRQHSRISQPSVGAGTAFLSWSWREAAAAFSLAVLYAITDELHQSFVPSRQGQPLDVLIDAGGAAAALLGLHLLGRWRHWW